MRVLRAFALGTVAGGALAFAAAAAVAVGAQVAGTTLEVAVGPLVLVAVEQARDGVATTIGTAVPALALAAGVVNALAGALLGGRG